MARTKKVVITNATREQADDAFAVYAAADAKQQQITAKMDAEFTRIREKFQDELADLEQEKGKAFDVMQAYATENREALFAKKKSIETVHGVFGFRTGTPALKTLKGFTWPAVTNMLKEFLPDYVRTIEEAAKDKLLADRERVEIAGLFDKCGIVVKQDETFYVEPKKEEV